ncbi:CENPE type kinesin-like protein [Volvox carteri f. nagariensis]|uniref:CENPE type kinesin-like protein n=1 Tax=Volvox carteri f. nagariensis TaxID=3068 RepID=D8U804_VOLCA|nr:CENPE type kinesin-like protein [Volvox carteri f. nagariensis]EFJ44133.1 CENPE type kinesin-like protein [Volvox carteri f. nagariensis]|eukprot:XP_002954727.1 CENPE type kinesin-like protein [Volvox carteri f. nagariensis]
MPSRNGSVCVRLRSLSKLEDKERCVWKVEDHYVIHTDADNGRRDADIRRDTDARRSSTYTGDHVFGPESTNEQVYREAVEALVHDAVEGKNVTIMVYGQTGSGKTHTMGTPEAPGIIQRGLMDIFELIAEKEDRDFLLRFSFLEIYNENVTDLLSPEKVPKPLLIKEDRVVGPVVLGLSEEIVTCPEDVLRLLRQGEARRHVAASKMNERSNRSHTVSRMVLESRPAGCEVSTSTPVIVSNLVLVDLAGSESVAKTGAEGERLKESSCINKSLLALGEVVFKLSEGALAAGAHIPYRDSKLTRILKPSLGGNCKTMIICTVNPAARHTEESHRTLRFACRAKRVVNTVVVQEVMSETAAARWQAKALKELQRRRAEGMCVRLVDF